MEILASRILLQVRDLEASLAFYEGALGLHRFREFGTAPNRGVVFFLGGGYLELTGSMLDTVPPPPPCVRIWLQVRDVTAAVASLGAVGVHVAEEPEHKPWGLIEASVHDPDGLVLVLVEIPAEHPMRRDTR